MQIKLTPDVTPWIKEQKEKLGLVKLLTFVSAKTTSAKSNLEALKFQFKVQGTFIGCPQNNPIKNDGSNTKRETNCRSEARKQKI